MARRLGHGLYWRIANNLHLLLGESLFNACAGKADMQILEPYLEEAGEFSPGELRFIIRETIDFCSDMAAWPIWRECGVFGFSCTFNQLAASLYGAELVKKHGGKTLFGGFMASCKRELLQGGIVDAVISGPGEDSLAQWLQSGCPGGFFDAGSDFEPVQPAYDPALGARSLIFEASRGCEHGACAFCAQNLKPGRRILSPGQLFVALEKGGKVPGKIHIEFADTSFPIASARELAKRPILRTGQKLRACLRNPAA